MTTWLRKRWREADAASHGGLAFGLKLLGMSLAFIAGAEVWRQALVAVTGEGPGNGWLKIGLGVALLHALSLLGRFLFAGKRKREGLT